MKKKIIIIILEILLLLGLGIFYTIKEVIPDLKKQYGSSDKVLNTKRYKNMIEIIIDDNIDFSILLDKDEKIYHMMFFSKDSIILYNRNIENSSLEVGIEKIIRLLIVNNNLNDNSKIYINNYNDIYYSSFINIFNNSLKKYLINVDINESNPTLLELVQRLDISGSGNIDSILFNLDYYSKEVKLSASSVSKEKVMLNRTNSKIYSRNVYEKIYKYIDENNYENLDKDNSLLFISMIPGDDNSKYYPSNNSWYYVNNKKIYAYIEFLEGNKKYGYCYRGDVNFINEGECD